MEEIIQRNISETLENAKHYKSNLEELLNSLTLAENQIQVSALHTEKQLEERFSQLKRNILDTIDERKKLLTTQVKQVEETSLAPLQQCRGLIQKSLDNADILLNEGSVILKRSNNEAQESLTTFNEKAAEIVSLPEVPSLSDVACISISFNDTWINKLTSHINNYGTVSPQGPVQITETIEQPGAITVFWEEVGDEVTDCAEYRLQCCQEPAKQEGMEFSDIYQGSTVPYRLRNTKPDTPYTFRVAVRAEGEKTWSLWSACHVTMTMLGHYEWETCKRPHYAVSDQNKLASKLSAQTQCIFSRDRTYTCGQLLIFRIVEQGKPHMSDGVGLVVQPRQANEDEEMTINSLMGNGAFCVSSSGQVYINGKEMVTRFPTLTTGMNIMYHTEVLPSVDKVRVSVEVAEKQVTFDWVTDFNRGKLDEKKLFFGACFKYPGWKLSVQ